MPDRMLVCLCLLLFLSVVNQEDPDTGSWIRVKSRPRCCIWSAEPYEDEQFAGTTMRFEGAPLDQFAADAEDSIRIVRAGDEFVVTGDLAAASESPEMTGIDISGLVAADVSISVTFPGEVTSHTGTLEGRTVTWRPSASDPVRIEARGSAVEGGAGLPLLAVVGIGVAALALVAALVVLLLRRRTEADTIPFGVATARPAGTFAPTSHPGP